MKSSYFYIDIKKKDNDSNIPKCTYQWHKLSTYFQINNALQIISLYQPIRLVKLSP